MDKIRRLHNLYIDEEKLSICGIISVESSNNKIIVVQLFERLLTLNGDDFNITHLNLEEGKLSATGIVKDLRYSSAHEKQAFFKRIFK